MILAIEEPTQVNEFHLTPGYWKAEFKVFERTNKTSEYIEYKSLLNVQNHSNFRDHPKDCTQELIEILLNIAKINKI